MSRLIPLLALVLSVAALAAALLRPAPTAEVAVERPAPHAEDELAALDRRIELLEETAQHLEQRVSELSRKPVYPAGDSGTVPPGIALEVAQLRSEVQGMIAGEALQSEGGKAYLRDAVRGVQEELANEERKVRAERFAAQQEKAQTEQKERWKKFVTDARLDYTQEQSLNRLLEAEATSRRTVMDQVRTGTKSFGDVRTELRASREQTDKEMKASLSAEQFQKYTEQRRGDRQGGGGGGFGERGGRQERGGQAP
jgi:hypothetical protein